MAEDLEARQPTKKEKQEERILQRVLTAIEQRVAELSSGMPNEEVGKVVRFMDSMRTMTASALLAAMLGSIYEYLALAGIVDMSPARVVLLCAVFFGSLFVWEIASLLRARTTIRVLTTIMGVLILTVAAIGLDRWAAVWRRAHPPEFAVLTGHVLGIEGTLEKLTTKQ